MSILSKLSSLNLQTKIIVTVLLLFLGSIWTLTFLISERLEQDMTAQIEAQQFSTASYIADSIEGQVKLRFESLSAIASLITPELISNPRKLRKSLSQRFLFGALFRNGVTVISKEGKGIVDYPMVPGRSTASFAGLEYFKDVITTLKPAIGKPQIGRFRHKPFVAFAVPIISRSSQLIGVLTASVSLSDPSLLGTIETTSYQGFPDGIILVSPKYRIVITGSDPTRIMTPSIKTGIYPALDKFMAGFEGSVISVNSRGVRMLLTAKQIPTPGWFIRVGLPTEIIFAPIKKMKLWANSLALGLSMLSSLLLWLVIRQTLIPLRVANKLIQDITDKRLPLQKIPVTRHDEIGQLLASFNEHLDYRRQAEEELQQTMERLRHATGVTIKAMAAAVETRDPYTAGHQTRSADLARAIATEMGMSQDKIEAIQMAGSIHDIGKLSIPAEILAKPTKLTTIELALIKEHAHQGYEILKDVESSWPLAETVYQHHERMDGSGYPRNLKGEQIIMEARILAVADVVESMASHRPYRPALGIETALQEIENNRGALYDTVVVDACLRIFREKRFQFL